MADLQQLKWILAEEPRQRPCSDGAHDEVILHPDVPADESNPKSRVEAMRRAGTNQHEIRSALHNIADGSITHGRQISRDLTPEEKAAGKNGDAQKIFAVCKKCHFRRELEQAPDDRSTVEAKDLNVGWGTSGQKANNLAFARNGGRVTYKLPAGHANGIKGRVIRSEFREVGAQKNLTIVAIG